jgi:hypothetical protein
MNSGTDWLRDQVLGGRSIRGRSGLGGYEGASQTTPVAAPATRVADALTTTSTGEQQVHAPGREQQSAGSSGEPVPLNRMVPLPTAAGNTIAQKSQSQISTAVAKRIADTTHRAIPQRLSMVTDYGTAEGFPDGICASADRRLVGPSGRLFR